MTALALLLALAVACATAAASTHRSAAAAKAKPAKKKSTKHKKGHGKSKKHRHARARVPQGFVGVNAGGTLIDQPSVNEAGQFDLMVASGVQSIRSVFDWNLAQPYASWADVPANQKSHFVNAGGLPTDFSRTDAIVRLAAQHGLTVLPTVINAPGWDEGANSSGGTRPPATPGPYGAFLTALIGRYGPHGSFWQTQHPKKPIRMWQIWNEENLPLYWPQPFAPTYVQLLAAAHTAIKRADPGAKIVIGALTNTAWVDLGKVYAIKGARKLFDIVSVNGFTETPSRVVEFLSLMRRAMNHIGDKHKPLLYTEMSWPSAVGQSLEHFDWDTTEAGQAHDITTVLPLLARHRKGLGLNGFYWYTWMTEETQGAFDDFDFAGLVRFSPGGQITAKPALAAYKRAALKLEGCRRKGKLATNCVK